MLTDGKDDWPSFSDELSRKAVETLGKWIDRVDTGKATRRDLYVVADAIYDTISGLVPLEISETPVAVLRELREAATRAKQERSSGS